MKHILMLVMFGLKLDQVIGIPHERLGEEICVFIQLKEKNMNENDVRHFLKDKVGVHLN